MAMCATNNAKIVSSLYQIFRRSRFYTSILLIFTFVLFFLIPFSVWNYFILFSTYPINVYYLNSVLLAVGLFSDAFIYIYVDDKVRKVMWKKLKLYKEAEVVQKVTAVTANKT